LHPTNRGVGLFGDKIYFASADAVLGRARCRTARSCGQRRSPNTKNGYYMSLMPLVADGKVMLGTSGGELGVAAGFVAAYDADTGKEVWRTYTVPEPANPAARPGRRAINGKRAAARFGYRAPTMRRPASLIGAPARRPLDGRSGVPAITSTHPRCLRWTARPVRSRATSSITKTIPGIGTRFRRRSWSITGAATGGQSLVDVARNGYLWQLERGGGKIGFVAAQPFVSHNVFTGVDPGTGRPIVDSAHKPGTGKTATFCPSLWGGKDWPPAAYSPRTHLLYIPANESLCTELTTCGAKIRTGRALHRRFQERVAVGCGADHIGELQAWDLR